MLKKCIDPCRLSRCWPSYTKPPIDLLDCEGGVVVKLPVGRLLWHTSPKIDVGFVPDLKVPTCNFVNTVPLDKMLGKSLDEVIPFRPIFWWSNIGLVPKRMKGIRRSQCSGHEAQPNEGLYAVGKQAIVDLVHIRKIVGRMLLTV